MTDKENASELQRKMEDARAKNMRMREEIAAIREEHNYWRALYHTAAVNIFTQLASNCEFDVKQTAEKARIRAKELIRQLREEESSQRL